MGFGVVWNSLIVGGVVIVAWWLCWLVEVVMVMEGRVEGRIGRGRRRGHLRRDIGGLARDIMCEYEDVGGLFGRGSGSEVVWFFFFFLLEVMYGFMGAAERFLGGAELFT